MPGPHLAKIGETVRKRPKREPGWAQKMYERKNAAIDKSMDRAFDAHKRIRTNALEMSLDRVFAKPKRVSVGSVRKLRAGVLDKSLNQAFKSKHVASSRKSLSAWMGRVVGLLVVLSVNPHQVFNAHRDLSWERNRLSVDERLDQQMRRGYLDVIMKRQNNGR